jgi:MOSC domain-containing protein YiiM
MNVLISQKGPRKLPLHGRSDGPRFGLSIDSQLAPCEVILSLATEPVVFLQMKQVRRGFQNEVPSGPVWVDRSGMAGGHSAKCALNIGPDRAIYAYSARHYPKWRAAFPSLANVFHAGAFGERFTLTGVDEEAVCIGDIIRIGSCHLQLSEPGRPNEWLFASPRREIIEAAIRTNRTGWYYRIIEPGWVTAGDSVTLTKRPNPSWSVGRFSQILGAEDPTRKELAELTTLKGLGSEWQWAARKALKGVEQSLALFWGR